MRREKIEAKEKLARRSSAVIAVAALLPTGSRGTFTSDKGFSEKNTVQPSRTAFWRLSPILPACLPEGCCQRVRFKAIWHLEKSRVTSNPARRTKPGPATGPCAGGFGVKTHAKLTLRYCQALADAPFTPKPGHIAQSPCLTPWRAEFLRQAAHLNPRHIQVRQILTSSCSHTQPLAKSAGRYALRRLRRSTRSGRGTRSKAYRPADSPTKVMSA